MLCHLRRFSSFSMADQGPVVPADGAVAAAVDRPTVAVVEKNAQNANGNVVPAPQPAAPEPEVSVSLVVVFV